MSRAHPGTDTRAGTRAPSADSPLRTVRAELSAGTPTLDEVARRTGLDREIVSAAVGHLVRIGRVSSSTLATACPDGGCGGCGASPSCASRGAPAPAGSRPVLVTLSVRRPHTPH